MVFLEMWLLCGVVVNLGKEGEDFLAKIIFLAVVTGFLAGLLLSLTMFLILTFVILGMTLYKTDSSLILIF